MDRVLEFDYMFKDTVCTHVWVNWDTGEVRREDFVDNVDYTVFGVNEPCIDELLEFFEDRTYPPTRPDIDEICEAYGVNGYNPYEMCLVSKGRQWHDYFWIRFKGDTSTFKDNFPV